MGGKGVRGEGESDTYFSDTPNVVMTKNKKWLQLKMKISTHQHLYMYINYNVCLFVCLSYNVFFSEVFSENRCKVTTRNSKGL